MESSWLRCGLNANLSYFFLKPFPVSTTCFINWLLSATAFFVRFQPYARMTRTILFEEISVYTISCVCCFLVVYENICFRVAVGFQAAPPKGGRVGSTLLWTTFFLLELQWGMIQLPWDPNRYDYISIHFFFLATWNIWDHSQSGHFVEVRCFAFLSRGDLQTVCCTCYGIYIDSQDILLRLDEYRQSEPE
jgi:hypothetical protein